MKEINQIKNSTIEYATPSRRRCWPPWLLAAVPLVFCALGAGAYAGARLLRASQLSSREFYGRLRVALEGSAMLLLAAGTLCGIFAVLRTRRPIALAGLLCCTAVLAFVVYHLLLSVKK